MNFINGRGLVAIKKQDYTAIVAAALDGVTLQTPTTRNSVALTPEMTQQLSSQMGGAPSTAKPTSANLIRSLSVIDERYARGLREGDMTAFLPWLRRHAKGQILEIGTRDGASTSAFLLGLEENDPSGHLHSIDTADCSHLWQHPQWTFTRGNSLAAKFDDATFDVALVDGDHFESAVIGDLFNCYAWVKPGGLILVHDCIPERGHEFYAVQIGERVRWFAELKNMEWAILPGPFGMAVLKR